MRRTGIGLAALCIAAAPRPLPAQCPDGTPPPCATTRGARNTPPAPTSGAVLYFENLSRDTNDLYLADGLTEEITSRLGAVTRLRVTGRTVVRRAQQSAGGDALDPSNAEAQHTLGVILQSIPNDSASALQFQRALALDPA